MTRARVTSESIIPGYHCDEMGDTARLVVGANSWCWPGHWVRGGPWERFGRYNTYVVLRSDGAVTTVPAHAGELVPGATEDLIAVIQRYRVEGGLRAPMTLELDPTYRCSSRDCGGHCFSAAYRALAPRALVPAESLRHILTDFAEHGGRIVRFDGGGDPLSHPAVRSGDLPALAQRLGLKSTILTSGDLVGESDLERLGAANCYLRVSLNAAFDATRRRFHGNNVPLSDIVRALERFAGWLARENPTLPIGATFLLSSINYREVFECARRAKDIGISHFSVRRILGPQRLRPPFSPVEVAEAQCELAKVETLASEQFRVFVPWRPLEEPDVSPAGGALHTADCWQTVFKTVIEPSALPGRYRAQLCGRYRGSGVGQRMRMAPLFEASDGAGWTTRWAQSLSSYEVPHSELPRRCVSCIDRGFIVMVDRLLGFLGERDPAGFTLLHLHSSERRRE